MEMRDCCLLLSCMIWVHPLMQPLRAGTHFPSKRLQSQRAEPQLTDRQCEKGWVVCWKGRTGCLAFWRCRSSAACPHPFASSISTPPIPENQFNSGARRPPSIPSNQQPWADRKTCGVADYSTAGELAAQLSGEGGDVVVFSSDSARLFGNVLYLLIGPSHTRLLMESESTIRPTGCQNVEPCAWWFTRVEQHGTKFGCAFSAEAADPRRTNLNLSSSSSNKPNSGSES